MLDIMNGRSRTTIDPRIPIMQGRSVAFNGGGYEQLVHEAMQEWFDRVLDTVSLATCFH